MTPNCRKHLVTVEMEYDEPMTRQDWRDVAEWTLWAFVLVFAVTLLIGVKL